jgi:hypothetical protein
MSNREILSIQIKDQELINVFLKNKSVDLAFDKNAFIGGGFARDIALSLTKGENAYKNILCYLSLYEDADSTAVNDPDGFSSIKQATGLFSVSRGDIDIFFRNNNDYILLNEKINYLYGHRLAKTQFSNTLADTFKLKNSKSHFYDNHFSIQFVNKFFYNSLYEMFDNFDILNSCYAIMKQNNNYFVFYDKKALEHDLKEELIIQNANSPYTVQRIVKYLRYRKIESISNTSLNLLDEILMKIASKNFEEKYHFDYTNQRLGSFLECLLVDRKYCIDSLTYFIGNYSVYKSEEKYGKEIFVSDWAISNMQKLSAYYKI